MRNTLRKKIFRVKWLMMSERSRHLQQEYDNNPSSKSVYEWIQKYTDAAIKDFKDYHPQVGDTWIADETVLHISGQNIWMYDIIDRDTRFLFATRFTTSRTTKDAQILMERAEKCAGKKPKVVITDKNNSYLDGIEMAYGADSEHIQSRPFALENNTELIERFHSTLKSRTIIRMQQYDSSECNSKPAARDFSKW